MLGSAAQYAMSRRKWGRRVSGDSILLKFRYLYFYIVFIRIIQQSEALSSAIKTQSECLNTALPLPNQSCGKTLQYKILPNRGFRAWMHQLIKIHNRSSILTRIDHCQNCPARLEIWILSVLRSMPFGCNLDKESQLNTGQS